jgi:hypothetical protein
MNIDHIFHRKNFFSIKALRDGTELFVDATEFCSQLDW